MKIVEIEWLDSTESIRWHDVEEVAKLNPTLCRSVGYLARKDKVAVVVMAHHSQDTNEGCGIMTIPPKAVKKIRYLK